MNRLLFAMLLPFRSCREEYRRRRVNAGGNVFAFSRSRWLRCPSLLLARWAGLGCLMREVGIFGIWNSSFCVVPPFYSARFPAGIGRSVDLDSPGRVPEAGLRHARHAACSTWRPGIVTCIEMAKKRKIIEQYD